MRGLAISLSLSDRGLEGFSARSAFPSSREQSIENFINAYLSSQRGSIEAGFASSQRSGGEASPKGLGIC